MVEDFFLVLKLKCGGSKRTRADNEMETCLYKSFIWIVKGLLPWALYGMDEWDWVIS